MKREFASKQTHFVLAADNKAAGVIFSTKK